MGIATAGNLLLALQLTPVEFGRLGAAYSVGQVVTAIGIFGYDQLLLQRAIAPMSALVRSVGVVLVAGLIAIAAAAVLVDSSVLPLTVAVVGSVCIMQLLSVFLCTVQAAGMDFLRSGADGLARVASQSGQNLGARLFSTAESAAWGALAAAVFVAVGSWLYGWRRLRALWSAPPSAGPRRATPYGMIGILYTSAIVVVGLWVAASGDDLENASMRILLLAYNVLVLIGAAVSGEYFRTRLYRLVASGGDVAVAVRLLWRSLIVAAPAVVGGLIVASFAVVPVLGHEYEHARLGLLILAAGVPAHLAQSAMASLVIARGGERLSLARQAVVLAAVALVVFLVPASARAAVIVLVAADVAGALFYAAALRRKSRLERPRTRD